MKSGKKVGFSSNVFFFKLCIITMLSNIKIFCTIEFEKKKLLFVEKVGKYLSEIRRVEEGRREKEGCLKID